MEILPPFSLAAAVGNRHPWLAKARQKCASACMHHLRPQTLPDQDCIVYCQ